MYDSDGTGCLLKVANADAGSEIAFNLVSTLGERGQATLKLKAGASFGHKSFYLPHSRKTQANMTGTARYTNVPNCSWPVKTSDPSAHTIFVCKEFPPWNRAIAEKHQTTVPVGDGKILTFYYYYRPWIY